MKTLTIAILVWIAFCFLAFRCFGSDVAGWEPSPDFIRYMKQVEGFRPTPYNSFEGGAKTVGYGHKIKAGEAFVYLSEEDATRLLKTDLKAAYSVACRQLGYVPRGTQAEIAVDYTFNGCPPRKFPKFFDAMKRGDKEGMRREYKRYCGKKELKGRNTSFENRYL